MTVTQEQLLDEAEALESDAALHARFGREEAAELSLAAAAAKREEAVDAPSGVTEASDEERAVERANPGRLTMVERAVSDQSTMIRDIAVGLAVATRAVVNLATATGQNVEEIMDQARREVANPESRLAAPPSVGEDVAVTGAGVEPPAPTEEPVDQADADEAAAGESEPSGDALARQALEGTVEDVLAWVDADPAARLDAAIELESDAEKPRKTLIEALERRYEESENDDDA